MKSLRTLMFLVLLPAYIFSGCTSKGPSLNIVSIKLNKVNTTEVIKVKDKDLIKEFERQVNNSKKSDGLLIFRFEFYANLNYSDSSETIYMTDKTMYIGGKYYKLNDTVYKTEEDLGAICKKMVERK